MRVVPLEAFRDKVSFTVAVAAVERGFRALGEGTARLPDPLVFELPEIPAEVHVKAARVPGGRHIVLKLATGFYKNRERGLPSGDATSQPMRRPGRPYALDSPCTQMSLSYLPHKVGVVLPSRSAPV